MDENQALKEQVSDFRDTLTPEQMALYVDPSSRPGMTPMPDFDLGPGEVLGYHHDPFRDMNMWDKKAEIFLETLSPEQRVQFQTIQDSQPSEDVPEFKDALRDSLDALRDHVFQPYKSFDESGFLDDNHGFVAKGAQEVEGGNISVSFQNGETRIVVNGQHADGGLASIANEVSSPDSAAQKIAGEMSKQLDQGEVGLELAENQSAMLQVKP